MTNLWDLRGPAQLLGIELTPMELGELEQN
jgi:hypothetical protein